MKSVKKLYRMLLLCVCLALVVPVTGIAASNSVSIMYMGSKKTEKKLTVKTSNKKVVSVKKSGKKTVITPKKEGEATLKYYQGKKLKKKVSVLVLKKSSVSYDTSKLTIKAGTTKTVKAKAPKKCKVSYSSSNKKVATVTSKGAIKGVKDGSCTITAKITYKKKTVKTFKKKVTVSRTGAESGSAGNANTSGKDKDKNGQGSSTGNSTENNGNNAGSGSSTGNTGSSTGDNTGSSTSGGSSSSGSGSGSTDVKATLESITASCTKSSVKEGYHFTLDDFVVYGNYSDGSTQRIYNFRITASYASNNGYYEVAIDKDGQVVKVKVPVSKDGADDDYDPSLDNPTSKVEAVGIEVEFAQTEISEDYDFPMSDFTVYTVYSDGSKKLAAGFGYETTYKDGYYYITVTSGNFKKELKVKAAASVTAPTVTRVRFTLTSSNVKVGENLAPGQIKVTAIYSDGVEKDVTDFTHDFTPKTTPGKYPVNITWGNFKGTVTVNVVTDEPALQSVDIKFAREFLYLDEQPSKDDIIVTGNYANGEKKRVTDFTFTFTPAAGHGQKAVITVTILGQSTNLNVPCYDRNIPVGLHVTLNKPTIKVNENIDPSTIVLKVDYRDGRQAVETGFTLDFTPKSVPGSYPVVLTFRGETIQFTITVVE